MPLLPIKVIQASLTLETHTMSFYSKIHKDNNLQYIELSNNVPG